MLERSESRRGGVMAVAPPPGSRFAFATLPRKRGRDKKDYCSIRS